MERSQKSHYMLIMFKKTYARKQKYIHEGYVRMQCHINSFSEDSQGRQAARKERNSLLNYTLDFLAEIKSPHSFKFKESEEGKNAVPREQLRNCVGKIWPEIECSTFFVDECPWQKLVKSSFPFYSLPGRSTLFLSFLSKSTLLIGFVKFSRNQQPVCGCEQQTWGQSDERQAG